MAGINDATRGRLLFGGDYNPEQWPAEVWPEDIRLMREAGVTLATVGVFSWATIEPRPGAREFGWLDRVLDLLHEGGIGVALATPTASPPPWMGARHPETLPRDEHGGTVWYGARNQFCASSPVYRDYAARITEDVARRYAGHPALRMWHINNEYGTACWCDTTAAHFRTWLRERHGSLEGLNAAWGTAFWSQRYDSWEEVIPPRRAQYLNNPAQLLDFRRFTSDALLECFVAERDIVAAHSPGVPVTTNFMPLFAGQDGWRWAAEEDVVSVDIYPDPGAGHDDAVAGPSYGALVQDLTRSQAGGPWMLMEQAASAVNFRPVNQPKPAGVTRLWSLQAVARGADGICFFQWRASRQGSEKFHSAMLPHAGEHSRAFGRIRELGAELASLTPLLGSAVTADIAVLHDWPAWWASEQPGRPSSAVGYTRVLSAWHHALWQRNLTCDFAHPEADLTGYRMVVVPQLYLLSDAALDSLAAYVRDGGTLVCGFFTGVADPDDRVREGGVDARLREVLGLAVEEWGPLPEGTTVALDDGSAGSLWSEDLEPAGAETVRAYADGELAGRPAVTRHSHGRGTAWYVSTLPGEAALAGLLAEAAAAADVEPVLPGLPPGVEAVRRGGYLVLLNHSREQVTIPLPHPHTDLLTGHPHPAGITLDRYGVAFLHPHTEGSGACVDSSSPPPPPRHSSPLSD